MRLVLCGFRFFLGFRALRLFLVFGSVNGIGGQYEIHTDGTVSRFSSSSSSYDCIGTGDGEGVEAHLKCDEGAPGVGNGDQYAVSSVQLVQDSTV